MASVFGTYKEKLAEFLEYFNDSDVEQDENDDDEAMADGQATEEALIQFQQKKMDAEYNYLLKHGKIAHSGADASKLQVTERKTKTSSVLRPIVEDTDVETFQGYLNSISVFFADMFK